MSNTNTNFEITGILLGKEISKRKTPQEKIAIIQLIMEPGMNISHVAHLRIIQPSCCLNGRSNIRKERFTAVVAREEVVSSPELATALKQVRELQRSQLLQ